MADNGGNVSIRFSVQDAETVRKALEQLGKDGEAALRRVDQASKTPSSGLKAVSDVSSELQSRARGLASSAGLVGTALSALGPYGLAAGAVIGGLALIMYEATRRANEFAAGAKALKDNAATAGITISQYATLQSIGSKVGLTAEETAGFIDKLTVSLDQLRQGGGPLFDQLLKIDAGLVRELAATKDTAAAWDILAGAYARATDQFQRNAIARAIGGRGGVDGGRLLEFTAASGGLALIARQAQEAGKEIDEGLVKRISALKLEIDATNKRAQTLINSLFSEEILQKELRAAELWERMAKASKDIADSQAGMSWWQRWLDTVGRAALGESAVDPKVVEQDTQRRAARNRLAAGLNRGETWDGKSWLPRGGRTEPEGPPAPAPKVPAAVSLELMQRWVAVLGNAITPSEQLKLKQLELAAAQEKGGVSSTVAARALAGFKNAQEQASVAVRESLGVASEADIVRAKGIALDKAIADGHVKNAEDIARAEQIIQREARNSYEALAVRNSALPGLKQLELDSGRLDRQLDQAATGSVNAMTDAIVQLGNGTQTTGQVFQNFGMSVISMITRMIVQMTIAAPIARALSSALTSFLPGGGGATTNNALGGVYDSPSLSAFSSSIVARPTFFRFASGGALNVGQMGEAGPEAIMPLTRIGGRLGVQAVGGAGVSVQNNIRIVSDGPSVSVKTQKRNSSGGMDLDLFVQQFDGALAGRISSGQSQTGKVLSSQFGVQRKF